MIRRNIIYLFLPVSAVLYIAASCVPLDTSPLTSETDLNYWNNPNSAIETVNSCYKNIGNPSQILYMEGASDNAYVRTSSDQTQAIGNGSYSTADKFVESFWSYHFAGIKMCNRLTENIHLVPDLTDEMRNRITAEAKVIRALHYHELAVRFGDVPFILNVLTVDEAKSISRTPRATVVNNILTELDEIIDNHYLPESYGSGDIGRVTHWAAMALKARILLNEGRFEETKEVTSEIIEKSGHKLFGDFAGLFSVDNENNEEIILDIQYGLNLRENNGNYQFLPPSLAGIANVCPTNELVESFIMLNGKGIHEDGSGYDPSNPWKDRDPRLEATICVDGGYYVKADGTKHTVIIDPSSNSDDRFQPGTAVITTSTGYYFKKFYDNQATTAQKSGLNYPLIRYADVLLMYAEACAETNSLDEQAWNKSIYLIRERAGFTDRGALDFPSGKTKEELIEIVRNERRCELAFEGLRMKDIYRWRTAEDVLSGNVHGMYTGAAVGTDDGFHIVETRRFDSSKHYLWPVPQSEKDINGNLGQNPNW